MTPSQVVIDTNVFVSGIITADADAPTAVIVGAMLEGRFTYLLSIELLAEYRRVLLRPKIRKHHGLAPGEVDALLAEVAANGLLRDLARGAEPVPHRKDDHLWALLAAEAGTVLVTGEDRLLKNPPATASVISARTFVGTIPRPPRQSTTE